MQVEPPLQLIPPPVTEPLPATATVSCAVAVELEKVALTFRSLVICTVQDLPLPPLAQSPPQELKKYPSTGVWTTVSVDWSSTSHVHLLAPLEPQSTFTPGGDAESVTSPPAAEAACPPLRNVDGIAVMAPVPSFPGAFATETSAFAPLSAASAVRTSAAVLVIEPPARPSVTVIAVPATPTDSEAVTPGSRYWTEIEFPPVPAVLAV